MAHVPSISTILRWATTPPEMSAPADGLNGLFIANNVSRAARP